MNRRLTIKDVAKAANVSIATVSRVMNDHHWVSEKAKEKVLKAIDELGYEPNALARGLVSNRSNSIGVLIPDISNHIYAKLFRGMEDFAHTMNSNVIICNTDRKKERMLRYMRFLREKQVDGIIFTSDILTEEYVVELQTSNIPVVLVATESEKHLFPSVRVNDVQAAFDAVQLLIQHGHQEIGMISGPFEDTIAGLPRFEGFQSSLRSKGLSCREENVVIGDFRFESGREGLKRLITQNKSITAVFCSSDEMALGAMVGAKEMGLSIPEDLSVIGFDNVSIAEFSYPALTTMAQPLYEMGYQGMKKLFEMINLSPAAVESNTTETTTYLSHKVMQRDSVTSPAAHLT